MPNGIQSHVAIGQARVRASRTYEDCMQDVKALICDRLQKLEQNGGTDLSAAMQDVAARAAAGGTAGGPAAVAQDAWLVRMVWRTVADIRMLYLKALKVTSDSGANITVDWSTARDLLAPVVNFRTFDCRRFNRHCVKAVSRAHAAEAFRSLFDHLGGTVDDDAVVVQESASKQSQSLKDKASLPDGSSKRHRGGRVGDNGVGGVSANAQAADTHWSQWRRLESRTAPGTFWWLHTVTGETSVRPPTEEAAAELERFLRARKIGGAGDTHQAMSDWTQVDSTQYPGNKYWLNTRTGESMWARPLD